MTNQIKLTWWNSPARNAVYARWCFLVVINAAFPFFLSLIVLSRTAQFIGVLMALASFTVIYAELDLWLIDKQHLTLSKQLKTSAAIKIATPLLPFIDMLTGSASIAATTVLTGYNLEQAGINPSYNEIDTANPTDQVSATLNMALVYLTTMIDGVLLSLLVGIILLLLRGTGRIWTNVRKFMDERST